MPLIERLPASLQRIAFNLFPAYRGTGARVVRLSKDWREMDVELRLSLRTRNYVGTIFGGSMFGAADPMYMVMLIRNLGPEYVVWDKSGSIRFRRPAKTTLRLAFRLTEAELDAIRAAVAADGKVERTYAIELKGEDGTVYAVVEKLIHIAKKKREGDPAA